MSLLYRVKQPFYARIEKEGKEEILYFAKEQYLTEAEYKEVPKQEQENFCECAGEDEATKTAKLEEAKAKRKSEEEAKKAKENQKKK